MSKPLVVMLTCDECGTEFRRWSGTSRQCSFECRFLARIEVGPDCWTWTGPQNIHGYGQMRLRRGDSPLMAYRISYELAVGPIPDGMHLDHLCRNRLCVNPDHLEPVTQRENWRRGDSPSAITYRTGICRRGHSMDDAIVRRDGRRFCRSCENDGVLRRRSARKVAAND